MLGMMLFAIQLCWAPPTMNVDGSVIAGNELPLTYNVHYGVESGLHMNGFPVDPTPIDSCLTWEPEPGVYYVAMTATNALGERSAISNEVIKTQLAPAPGVPQAPVILADEQVAFTLIKQPNRFLLLPIGTVPAGTVCDPTQTVNGLGAVPTDDVQWTCQDDIPNGIFCPRPVVVVASCVG